MQHDRIAAETLAEAYLVLLKRHGIDRLYVNAGTDTASIVEAYSRADESGLAFPEPVVCTHENVAVGMAHGYAMVTGRPQALMVHVSVGAANALMGVMNAARDSIPMLVTAGRTPLFEEGRLGARSGLIHWAQEMFDQGGMLREFVKWDYELRDALHVAQAVDRALAIAKAEPPGPVYLTLPREVLAQTISGGLAVPPGQAVPAPPHPDPAAIDAAASILASAKFPVIVAAGSGRDPTTVQLLADLAARYALGVVESRARVVCCPSDHPMHLGYEVEPLLADADALFVLESDVPWLPHLAKPRPETRIIQAGADPLYTRYPMRSFRAELSITGAPRGLLDALGAALARAPADGIAARREAIARRGAAIAEAATAAAAKDAQAGGGINPLYLSRCLDAVKPADAIIVNEYWALRGHLRFSQPGTYFQYPPAGGLGWGLPAALGAQQALPDRTVIATLGDGAYLFANPAACHHAAAMHGLPVLTVICNNARWEAVARAARTLYPKGAASRRNRVPLASLEPSPDYERYVEASGGYGERVERREALPDALARALKVVREERRQALLNVICA